MEVFWCNNCLNMSTRPRITFDKRGWCNACQWMEEKKSLDWSERLSQLDKLISKHKDKGPYDCLVAVSGGKDGSYVAHTLKTKYKLKVLTITVRPPLSLEIGAKNLTSFIRSGYDHIHISPDSEAMRTLDTIGFKEYGQGYYGWIISIHTAVLRIANNFGISLIFYSEDGEVEYGGGTEHQYEGVYGIDYMKRVYLNDTYSKVLDKASLTAKNSYWFKFPNENMETLNDLEITHLSFYENWDPYRNYLVAKEFCGLEDKEGANIATFTNFAQNDQYLTSLHYYLMYLKFGFGRATADAGIEIRRGAMTRDQAINLVKMYDGNSPRKFFGIYSDYFKMSIEEFETYIDKFANKKLFEQTNEGWVPKFEVGKPFLFN